MNMISHTDRNLAETLKSLSIEDTPRQPSAARKYLRGAGLIALVAGSAMGIILLSAPLIEDLRAARSDPASDITHQPAPIAPAPAKPGHADLISVASPAIPQREITGSGYAIAPHSTFVFSRTNGTVLKVLVAEGDQVTANQVLVVLDDPQTEFALEKAIMAKAAAGLNRAAQDIDLNAAQLAFDRAEGLMARNALTKRKMEEATTALKQARNQRAIADQQMAQADLNLRIAQHDVDSLQVRAPFAGTVTQLLAEIGDTVRAPTSELRSGQSLLTLTDTRHLVIDADVAEHNIAALRPGQRGEAVLDGFPDQSFGIELNRIAPVASVAKGTVTLRFHLINPPMGVRPNMAARIRLTPEPTALHATVQESEHSR